MRQNKTDIKREKKTDKKIIKSNSGLGHLKTGHLNVAMTQLEVSNIYGMFNSIMKG